MKRTLRFIALFMSVVILCVIPVSATEIAPMDSTHIDNCYGHIEMSAGYSVRVVFSIYAIGYMDELGASMIRVQRSTDGINWEICDTYWASDHPEMMGSGSVFESSVTYHGQAGYQYRAFIYFHAKNSSGTRTAMAYAY